ncbi:MAG: alpha/beta hydrolase [Acidobacteriota bacterium]
MKCTRVGSPSVPILALFVASALASPAAAQAPAAGTTASFESRSADAGGLRLSYLTGGNGPPLILLHGYAETSRMWIPIMPQLTAKFRVIAPDLPGIGDSAIPANGLDMKGAATSIHALARSLGITTARVVGHDIGLMVAYAYAAMYPAETEKLVLMDAFLPGVGRWETYYNDPRNWHFRFNGPTPEKLVQGRERTYFEHYWNDFAADGARSIPEADRQAYTAAYARPGRMRAGWAYFVSFLQAAKDSGELSQNRLTMPVLVVGGDKASGEFLAEQIKLVAGDLRAVIIRNAGHWIMEEQPAQTRDALLGFL